MNLVNPDRIAEFTEGIRGALPELSHMTLRDIFALVALGPVIADNLHGGDYYRYAEDAYALADAMLAERSK